jgi:glycosyltransferase 2 family protein
MPCAPNLISRAQTTRRVWRLPVLARGNFMLAARWLVTLLAFWVVFHSIDFGAVVGVIARARPLVLGLAGLVVAAQFVTLVLRWRIVIRIVGGKPASFGPLAFLLSQSLLIGQLLPSSVGGDAARTVMLAPSTGALAAARSVICDRVLGVASLALLVIPAVPVIVNEIGVFPSVLALTIAGLGTVAAVWLIYSAPSLPPTVPWVGRHFALIASDLRNSFRSARALGLALASNLLGVLSIYILGSAVGAGLRALDCLILVPPALLVSALPISLGGWGVREGVLVGAFSLVQADPAAAAATSVLFGLTTPLVGGIVAVASLFAGWRDLLAKDAHNGG